MEWPEEHVKRVVVVGGGIAGALVAKIVQDSADVYLIDSKEYFEIPWAHLKSKMEPASAEKSVIKHTDYLTNGTVITSTAVNITPTDVLTSEGRHVPYDYLVIATGHTYPTPRFRKDRLEQFQDDHDKIQTAKSVLIIGGGPTGVELAGEIANDHPGTKVTLVHRGARVLEFIGVKASNKALEWLRSKNVEVLLNQSIDLDTISESNGTYKTSNGDIIMADCHFVCVGKPVGSWWLRESFLKDYLDRNGRLMVDEKLRVGGRNNVFAIGDITDIRELKQGYIAQRHAVVAGKNLKLLIKGRDHKLEKYRGSFALAVVALGKRHGVAEIPVVSMGGFLPGILKSRDVFVSKTRRQLGLES